MRLLLLCLATQLLTVGPASACINEYDVDIHGRSHDLPGLDVTVSRFNRQDLLARLDLLGQQLKQSYDFRDYTDYGVNLLRIGRTAEALLIFQRLMAAHPDEYQIAANLGTAYELNGQPQLALKWIDRAVQLNPASHNGSEWVHQAILRTKMILAISPTWLNRHPVLSLAERGRDAAKIAGQVMIQLRERIPFTRAKDVLLARIIEEIADYEAQHLSVTKAVTNLQLAGEYDPARLPVLRAKIAAIKSRVARLPMHDRTLFNDDAITTLRMRLRDHAPLLVPDYKPLVLNRKNGSW
jgi:tetratricopeptide (TPR) repeat protein